MTNTAEKLTLPLFMVKYNGDLLISTGRSRFETSWKNKTMSWAALLNKLSRSMETTETHAEYMKMSKEQQDKIKDIGGFVGGHLRDGRRKTGYVTARQLLTLDLDFPPAEFWDNIIDNLEIDNALAVYSTHKHTKAKPRYRLIMPLDREVTPDEYEAIARKIAEKIGIDYFDDSTFQPTRLMYWPSHSVDVEPFFQYYDAPFLAADSILAEYPEALGVHDLEVHNYGPGHVIVTLHVEVDGRRDVFESHDMIDTIEKRLRRECGIEATIHMDPIVTDDAETDRVRAQVEAAVREVDAALTIHDFRFVPGPTHANLIFDIAAPFECKLTNEEIRRAVAGSVSRLDPTYFTVITVDRN